MEGGVNQEIFSSFIQSLSEILGEEEEVTILFDNAPSHAGVEARTAIPDRHQLRRLPAYSPFLNPIENIFSVMKATTKQHLAANQGRLENRVEAAHAGMSKTNWRRHILKEGIAISLRAVTGQLVDREYRHSNTFLPACAAKENISA